MKLFLASNSPRRRDILTRYGYDFTVIKSDFIEVGNFSDPIAETENFALGKAASVLARLENVSNAVVLGADTVVYFGGKIIGKPKDEKEAKRYLQMLSGKTHTVVTGYAVLSANKRVIGHDVSHVTFNVLPDSLINDYVATGKPLDKAGAYGLQDGFDLVSRYEGSYWNIVGLPIERIEKELKNFK